MKHLSIVLCLVLGLGVGTARAVTCDNTTLKGTMVAAIQRSLSGSPGASMDMESWDGAGHIQYLEIDTYGTSSSGLYYGTGTYTISSDCKATAYFDGGTNPWTYYVAPNGSGMSWINQQSAGVVSGGTYDMISTALIVDPLATTPGPCTLQSLSGTLNYGSEYSHSGVALATAGHESYDGRGHMVYEEVYSDGYTPTVYKGAGTYTVSDRCVAYVHYDGAARAMPFFVAPDGSAYWWANNYNVGTVSAGKSTRVSRGRLVIR